MGKVIAGSRAKKCYFINKLNLTIIGTKNRTQMLSGIDMDKRKPSQEDCFYC